MIIKNNIELTNEQLQVVFNGLDLLQHRVARPVVDELIAQLSEQKKKRDPVEETTSE